MKGREIIAYINFIAFGIGLSVMGVLFFVLPKKQVSDYEKRKLSSLPVFSPDKFFEGQYTDSLDLYVADNFPFRDALVEFSFDVKNNSGIHSKKVGFYNKSFDQESATVIDTAAIKTDSLTARTDTASVPGEAHESNGLMIVNGMGIQIFGGTDKMAAVYADVINRFYEKYKDKVQVYDAVTPTHGEFYLPQEYKKYYSSERKNINAIYEHLDSSIHKVDIYDALSSHTGEYIFFNTDHHWTGLGAYYAYVAYCNAAGITALRTDEMQKKTISNFLGSLYWLTRDPALKESEDSVIYYKSPVGTKAYMCSGPNYEKRTRGNTYVEFAKGPNAYGVFLGGDVPLIRIETDLKNGKRAMIVKNSYGNPFSTYLVSHYEQVDVVDYRYFKGSIGKIIAEDSITDLVFITPTFSANTLWHVNRMASIL